VKATQSSLQKIITWTKKLGKGIVERGLWLRKLKTPMKKIFASNLIMFEEILELKKAIILCYGQQKTIAL
jgi:hypothetical protein